MKANEAVTEVKELMVKAGVPPRVSERQEDSAEGSEEEGEKKDKAGAAGKSLLPALPYGGTTVKAVQKQNLAKVTDLLQNCNVTSGTPENLAMLWDDISRLIEGAGLSEAEVKAAIQGVTGQAAVTLCIGRSVDLEKWRRTLSDRYLNPTKAGNLLRRLHLARRTESETSVMFLARVAPLVRAVMLMKLVPTDTALGAVWDAEALGKEYCQSNSTLYEQILLSIEKGDVDNVDDLMQQVQVRAKLEAVPKVAAPVVPKNEKEKRCAHCNMKGHTQGKCWKSTPSCVQPGRPV